MDFAQENIAVDPAILVASVELNVPAYGGPGWTSCPFGLRSVGTRPLQYYPPVLRSIAYDPGEFSEESEELFENFTPGEYLLKIAERERSRADKARMRFGLPIKDIELVPLPLPMDPKYLYPPNLLSNRGFPHRPTASTLSPNPLTRLPPPEYAFPIAPVYTLNEELDPRWRRGYVYSSSVSVRHEDKARESDRLYKIATPPGVEPVRYDSHSKRWIMNPVDGMIEMPAGIPFVAKLDGFESTSHGEGRERYLTTACLQTLDSIDELYPLESPAVRTYVKEVQAITWGDRNTRPLFMMDGRKLNSRSATKVEGCADGSSSHGPTVEEVGPGWVIPASQGSSDFALVQQMKLLTRLAALYRLIVPMCVSKLEWDVWLARAQDVNAICCGGSFGFTSLQKNVSSKRKGGVLAVLGLLAAAWHVDIDDDPAGWTLILCILRLPPGTTVGDFMLGRAGLYARLWPDEEGNVVFFLLFKGNDIHSGTAPTADDKAWDEFIAKITPLFSHVGSENRVVYVMYPNRHCARRDAGVSIAKDVGFGSTQTPRDHTIAEEGFPALGTWDDLQVFLVREAAMYDYNFRRLSGIEPVNFPTDLFYHDLRGIKVPVNLPFDPEADFAHISELRGQYANLDLSGSLYNLRMSKPRFKTIQEATLAASVTTLAINTPEIVVSDPEAVTVELRAVEAPSCGASTPTIPVTEPRRSDRQLAKGLAESSVVAEATSQVATSQQARGQKKDGGEQGRPKKRHGAVQRELKAVIEEDGESYSVSMLIRTRYNITHGMSEYLCRFSGYSETDDWWVLESDLSAPQLVEEFKLKNNSNPGDQVHSDYLNRISPYSMRDDNCDAVDALERLLDIDNLVSLSHTVANLSRRRASIPLPKQCENLLTGTHDLAASLATWNEDQKFSGKSADDLFAHLTFAGKALASSTTILQEVEIMQSATSLSVCRSLRFIYLWRRLFGPNLAECVFDEVREKGESSSWQDASALMKAIQGLVEEEASCRESEPKSKRSKRGKAPEPLSAAAFSLTSSLPVSASSTNATGKPAKKGKGKRPVEDTRISTLPGNLYGLISSPTMDSITFSLSSSDIRLDNSDLQREVACNIFVTLIFNVIVAPHMETLDTYITRSAKTAGYTRRPGLSDSMSIQARTLLRGALLDSFVDWLDDDGLFASPVVLEVLQSPLGMLNLNRRTETKVLDSMAKGTEVFLALESWLREMYDASDIQQAGWSLAESLQEALSHLSKRAISVRTQPSKSLRQSQGGSFMEIHDHSKPRVSPDTPLSSLCPYSDGFRVDMLAFMIREALNYHDHRGIGDSALSKVIRGTDPVVRIQMKLKNIDHYNPIRAHNSLQTMVRTSFANLDFSEKPYGLSNLLVILGTGQGEPTRAFFDRSLCGKFFTSADSCVDAFQSAFSANPNICLDNKRCWGSACSWLGFTRAGEDRRPQFREKLDPYFSEHVVQLWNAFRTGSRKSYKEALALSENTKLDGFRSGLTRMQLANTLALLGLCELPSCDEMADIVHMHKNKGAFEGLQRLGLNVTASSTVEEVRLAFRCVFDFLDHQLRPEDKAILDFNAIFVEHLLCKVTRWEKAFPAKANHTLRTMAENTRNSRSEVAVSQPGETATARSFPFPLEVDRKQLLTWIESNRNRIGI
ncbi:hypothetical protein PM082_021947 [Marasmius tenuissimus]|nr:hypothetical protein PM082_021947 [Marasmius tenuissimus]